MAFTGEKLVRKAALMRKMGMLGHDSNVKVYWATEPETLIAAQKLVYDTYREKGYIDQQHGDRRVRIFDAVPEMVTFVAEVNGEIVGTMSLIADSADLGLPSDEPFSEEIDKLRRLSKANGKTVAEVTSLAIRPDYRRTSVFMALAQPILARAVTSGCNYLFIAISPGHGGFFEDVLGFEACGGSRSYSEDKIDIVEGKCWNIASLEHQFLEADQVLGEAAFLRKHFFTENPCLACAEARWTWAAEWAREADLAAAFFLTKSTLTQLFVDPLNYLQAFTESQHAALERRWGAELYQNVTGRAESLLHAVA